MLTDEFENSLTPISDYIQLKSEGKIAVRFMFRIDNRYFVSRNGICEEIVLDEIIDDFGLGYHNKIPYLKSIRGFGHIKIFDYDPNKNFLLEVKTGKSIRILSQKPQDFYTCEVLRVLVSRNVVKNEGFYLDRIQHKENITDLQKILSIVTKIPFNIVFDVMELGLPIEEIIYHSQWLKPGLNIINSVYLTKPNPNPRFLHRRSTSTSTSTNNNNLYFSRYQTIPPISEVLRWLFYANGYSHLKNMECIESLKTNFDAELRYSSAVLILPDNFTYYYRDGVKTEYHFVVFCNGFVLLSLNRDEIYAIHSPTTRNPLIDNSIKIAEFQKLFDSVPIEYVDSALDLVDLTSYDVSSSKEHKKLLGRWFSPIVIDWLLKKARPKYQRQN